MLTQAQVLKMRTQVIKDGDERLPAVFGVLGDPCRFRFFRLLRDNTGKLCVTDLANICDISVPAASQQLKMMELAGVVERQRCGQKICYQLNLKDRVIATLTKLIR